MNGLIVQIFTVEEAAKLIYESSVVDLTVFDRIQYFSSFDFNYNPNADRMFFTMVLDGKKIVAIAKLAYYSLNARNDSDWSIGFFSIDEEYRCKGLSRLMADAMFAEAKNRELEVSTSSYTVLGKERIRHIFNQTAKKHCVVFHDKEDEDHTCIV